MENPPVLTAVVGTNADLLPEVFKIWIEDGWRVADVTFGRGTFWQKIDASKYRTFFTDLTDGVDFRKLPYADASMEAVILDPPYMHGGSTVKTSINDLYRNQNGSHASVIRLYAGGILESARVLMRGGILMVKCQDEIESGRQRLSHVEIVSLLQILGFSVMDIFVLVQTGIPAMRVDYQKSARKNHSFLIVAKLLS